MRGYDRAPRGTNILQQFGNADSWLRFIGAEMVFVLQSGSRRGGPDAALSVWVVEQQEVTQGAFDFRSLLFLRHPDIQSDVWATPPQ